MCSAVYPMALLQVTYEKSHLLLDLLVKIVQYLSVTGNSPFRYKGAAIQKFVELLKIVFRASNERTVHIDQLKRCFKVSCCHMSKFVSWAAAPTCLNSFRKKEHYIILAHLLTQYFIISLCLSGVSTYFSLPPLYRKTRYLFVITMLCVHVHPCVLPLNLLIVPSIFLKMGMNVVLCTSNIFQFPAVTNNNMAHAWNRTVRVTLVTPYLHHWSDVR